MKTVKVIDQNLARAFVKITFMASSANSLNNPILENIS